MNQPPGGSVEADVETRRNIERVRAALEGLCADAYGSHNGRGDAEHRNADLALNEVEAALTNLTDRIGEARFNGKTAEEWFYKLLAVEKKANAALDEQQTRIHYLEGRVGEDRCQSCGHEWTRHDPVDGMCDAHSDEGFGPCWCGRQLNRWMQANAEHARAALSPPMKGPNDEADSR